MLDHGLRRVKPVAAGAEGRGQRTEDRGQRTEDRGQRTEDRGQRGAGVAAASRGRLWWWRPAASPRECQHAQRYDYTKIFVPKSKISVPSDGMKFFSVVVLPRRAPGISSRKAAEVQRKMADRKRGTATIRSLGCSFWPSDLAHFDASEEFENLSLHLEIGS